jgi:predicted CoA-substrate-specific enzyme activase
MIVGGCDVGSATAKAVVMKDGALLSHAIVPSGTKPELAARKAMDDALGTASVGAIEAVDYIVGTGYGRLKIPFAGENVSEITCHARGAHWMSPAVRTVIDMGGQDCKAISIDDEGGVADFAMNDRCAAGTGRFFEAMARVLDCGFEGLSSLCLQGENPATISSQCSVFAESEVITLLNDGVELADIVAGLHHSIARRIHSLARRVGLVEDVCLSGGCAKNEGLASVLAEKWGVSVKTLPRDPQIAGALGAALIAGEKSSAERRAS